jgi:hypothetical protein
MSDTGFFPCTVNAFAFHGKFAVNFDKLNIADIIHIKPYQRLQCHMLEKTVEMGTLFSVDPRTLTQTNK